MQSNVSQLRWFRIELKNTLTRVIAGWVHCFGRPCAGHLKSQKLVRALKQLTRLNNALTQTSCVSALGENGILSYAVKRISEIQRGAVHPAPPEELAGGLMAG